MVAEIAPQPATRLPLLLPPDKPLTQTYRSFGWRYRPGTRFAVLDRRTEDDEQGAVVQWIVLRYYRDGVLRRELAAEYGFSERRVQEYLSGSKGHGGLACWWLAYAAPVLRALRRLGFPVDERCNTRKRTDAQVRAARTALAGVADLLAGDARPAARRLRRDIALLTVEATP